MMYSCAPRSGSSSAVVKSKKRGSLRIDIHCHYLNPDAAAKVAPLNPAAHEMQIKFANAITRETNKKQVAERARNKKTTLEELQGGTFTVTNLGGIGGTFFSPIINAPEVAILGVARSTIEAVYRDGQFAPRLMLPLALSYDHRLIDGADGARFVRWLVEALQQPFLIALGG